MNRRGLNLMKANPVLNQDQLQTLLDLAAEVDSLSDALKLLDESNLADFKKVRELCEKFYAIASTFEEQEEVKDGSV